MLIHMQSTDFTGKVDTSAIIYYILEQSKETTLEFSKGSASVVTTYKMVEYSSPNAKLSDTQLKKLKTTVKIKQEL